MNTFHRRAFVSLLVLVPLASFARARAAAVASPLKVVCTLPDLADMTKEIGGDRVEVSSLYKGHENTHALRPKPSHLVAMTRADVFVEIGLSLESSVVPGLLENCRNEKIAPGKPGFINVSEGWTPMDVPVVLSRQEGDVHPQGNPHMNMDPRAGPHMAKVIHDHLVLIDPGSKAGYDERFEAYMKKLDTAEKRWAEMGKAWKGKKIVVYHKEYDYFADAYGMTIQASIEVKPGIPPTPNHVAELVDAMKRDPGAVIVTAPWSNTDSVQRISEETGAKIVELPNMCGGMSGAETWIGMMDLVHDRMAAAFGTPKVDR